MICNQCGNQIEEGAMFCTRCGTPVMNNNQPIPMAPMNQVQANQPTKKRSAGLIIAIAGGVVAVLLVIVLAVVFFLLPMKDSYTTASRDNGKKEEKSKKEKETETQKLTIWFEEIISDGALPDVQVFVTEGYDNPDGEQLYEAVSEEDGKAKLKLEEGEYTLCWEADDYYGGYENLTVTDSALTYTKRMLPQLKAGNAYVLVEWESDEDLDLCIYNAETDEYISITNALDSQGNCLFADNDGEKGYELIRLDDYMSGSYTVYVRDGNSLLQEADSTMSEQGLRISFYTAEGLVYQKEASEDERAGLWSPFYLYDGQAVELDEYIYDMTDYRWAVRDKNDPSGILNEQAMLAYEAFLHGELATDKGYYLTDYIDELAMLTGYVTGIRYGYLDAEADGVQELLVSYECYEGFMMDTVIVNIILEYDGTALRQCYSYDARNYRHGADISYYGVINGGGSGGATHYVFDESVMRADGTVTEIYTAEREYALEGVLYQEPFYSDNVNFAEDGVTPPAGGCAIYQIADQHYIVYDEDVEVPYEEFQEFFDGYGYQTYRQEEIDEIIAAYAQQQGVERWLLEDDTEPEMYALEQEWYHEYVKPEVLKLSEEETEKLADIGCEIFDCIIYTQDWEGWKARNEAMGYSCDFLSGNIQQIVSDSMGSFLFWSGSIEDEQEEAWETYDTSYYKVREETAQAVIEELFDFTYDFTQLGTERKGDAGAYYEDGYVVVYVGTIGGDIGGVYQEMYQEDGYWKAEIVIADDYDDWGKITLYLSQRKNRFGYQIAGCDVERYY